MVGGSQVFLGVSQLDFDLELHQHTLSSPLLRRQRYLPQHQINNANTNTYLKTHRIVPHIYDLQRTSSLTGGASAQQCHTKAAKPRARAKSPRARQRRARISFKQLCVPILAHYHDIIADHSRNIRSSRITSKTASCPSPSRSQE